MVVFHFKKNGSIFVCFFFTFLPAATFCDWTDFLMIECRLGIGKKSMSLRKTNGVRTRPSATFLSKLIG